MNTHDDLINEIVTEAQLLLERLTPGEWRSDGECVVAEDGSHVVCFGHGYDDYGGIMARMTLLGDTSGPYNDWNHEPYDTEQAANRAFIAAAPALVRRLLAAIVRVRDVSRP